MRIFSLRPFVNTALQTAFLSTFYLNCIAQQPVALQYTVDDGLPSSEVYQAYQDKDGYIWFATDRGVAKFDGYSFRIFTSQQGLPDNTIFGFYEDDFRRLWLRSFNGRIAYISKDSVVELAVDPGALDYPNHWILSYHVDTDSTLYAGTARGLFKLIRLGQTEKYRLFDYKPGKSFVPFDPDGLVFGYCPPPPTNNTGGFNLDAYSFLHGIRLNKGDYLSGFTSILHLSRQLDSVAHFKFEKKAITIFEDSRENIWVGFSKGGVMAFPGIKLDAPPVFQLLDNFSVTGILEDREGGFWFTTIESGVYYVPKINVPTYTTRDGLSSTVARFLAGSKNDIYIGTYEHGVNCILPEKITGFKLPDSGNVEVQAMMTASDGALWVSGYHLHKIRMDPVGRPQIKTFRKVVGIKDIAEDEQGRIWVVGKSFARIAGDSLQLLPLPTDGNIMRYPSICVQQERVWVGSLAGLWQYQEEQFIHQGDRNPLLANRVSDLAAITHGPLFIATRGNGLLLDGPDTLLQIQADDGLAGNLCNTLFLENDSVIWVCTNQGLSRVAFKGLTYQSYSIRNFDLSDGLVSKQINQVYVYGKKVWVATNKGVTVLPNKVEAHQPAPPVHLASILINDSLVALSDKMELPHYQNRVQVNFAGLDYRSFGQLEYRYRLSGLDTNWHSSTGTEAAFAGLPPGSYRFEVVALNRAGKVSQTPATFEFIIHPPFWQTWWFKTLLTGLSVLTIYLFFHFQVLQYNKAILRELIRTLFKKIKGERYLFVKISGVLEKIELEKINYLKSSREYVEVTTTERTFLVHSSMKKFREDLPDPKSYIQTHRSYVVRIDKLTAIEADAVFIGSLKIPVSETYKAQLRALKQLKVQVLNG